MIVRTMIAGLDIVPATMQLAGAELEIAEVDEREYRLRTLLEPGKAMVRPIFSLIARRR